MGDDGGDGLGVRGRDEASRGQHARDYLADPMHHHHHYAVLGVEHKKNSVRFGHDIAIGNSNRRWNAKCVAVTSAADRFRSVRHPASAGTTPPAPVVRATGHDPAVPRECATPCRSCSIEAGRRCGCGSRRRRRRSHGSAAPGSGMHRDSRPAPVQRERAADQNVGDRHTAIGPRAIVASALHLRRLLAREHPDQPARDSIRSLTRAEPSQIRLSQEVMR